MLVSGSPVDSVGLSSVLSHVAVAELNEIISDWGGEDGWHGNAILDITAATGVDANSWARHI